MHPQIHLNWVRSSSRRCELFLRLALVRAAVREEMGEPDEIPTDMKPDPKVMMRGMVLMVIGTFLTTLSRVSSNIWRPSSWGTRPDRPATSRIFSRLFTWIGFYRADAAEPRSRGRQGVGAVRINGLMPSSIFS